MQSVWKSLEEGQGACAQCISGTGDAVPGCTLRKPATGRIQKALPGSAFKVWRAERYRLRMGIHEDQEHRVGQLVTVLIHVIYVPPVNDKADATDKVLAPVFPSTPQFQLRLSSVPSRLFSRLASLCFAL